MTQKEIRIISLTATAVVIIVGILLFWMGSEKKKLEADKMNFAKLEKEVMQEELDRLNEEYDVQYNKLVRSSGGELNMSFSNDSLANQLISERAKVNRLLEELSAVKSSNAKRINELRNEVKTLETVLRSYVVQIDSLNTANERLRTENKAVKADFERISTKANQLQQEKKALQGRVELAAKLNATNIGVRLLDKRGRKTNNLNRAESIEISFTVAKNITTDVGEKTFYARILNPNDEPLVRNSSDVMPFEGNNVPYSCRKVVEYGGDEMTITMYWPVNQALLSGQYRLYLVADGNMIGEKTFTL
ncbi:hypothetical protein [Porphyromonas macacae]|uniref:hypothetical protein n=1 Tax=Porphyromonas macacae TaxID=28115 RepID=UPI0024AD8BA4|nr:hypothetical protein [Porphyromonas macacae]